MVNDHTLNSLLTACVYAIPAHIPLPLVPSCPASLHAYAVWLLSLRQSVSKLLFVFEHHDHPVISGMPCARTLVRQCGLPGKLSNQPLSIMTDASTRLSQTYRRTVRRSLMKDLFCL